MTVYVLFEINHALDRERYLDCFASADKASSEVVRLKEERLPDGFGGTTRNTRDYEVRGVIPK